MAKFGRRDMSDAEIRAILLEYEPLPHRKGHMFSDRDGKRHRILNAMPDDQCFLSERYGVLNVSLALENIAREAMHPHRVALDEGIKAHVALVEIDQRVVRQMSVTRRNEPILMMLAEDGVNVVDGHHRLARLVADGSTYFRAYLMRPETYDYMLVERQELRDGAWAEEGDGPSRQDVLEAIERTKMRWPGDTFIRNVRPLRGA
jgi:hypothetical protein